MQRRSSARVHAAFVMEQTLGHVTHSQNLRQAVETRSEISAEWLAVPFAARGAERLIPVMRSNWSVRASWRARRALDAAMSRSRFDIVFFHTQVTSLFSHSIMRRLPSIVSMDATPMNYDSIGASYGHSPAGGGMLDRRKYELNKRSFQSAAALVTWTEWARQSLVSDYGVDPEIVRVISPGAATEFFELGQSRAAPPANGTNE